MSSVPPSNERSRQAVVDKDGRPSFQWSLTRSSLTDTVKLVAGPFNVLPVVFVPGIMGSNLKDLSGQPVWRLDNVVGGKPLKLAKQWAFAKPGERQRVLHPAKVKVDDHGAVPKGSKAQHSADVYRSRGWGTVSETSYHEFLLWLEEMLNPTERNPARWPDFYQTEATIGPVPASGEEPKLFPGIRMGLKGEPFHAEKIFSPLLTDDLLKRSKYLMPVYAVGYNWLDDNKNAAKSLAERIQGIVKANNQGSFRCQQVLVVTHSMGGLVARACAALPGMESTIAGVVHGVT